MPTDSSSEKCRVGTAHQFLIRNLFIALINMFSQLTNQTTSLPSSLRKEGDEVMNLMTARQWGRRGFSLLAAALVLMVVLTPGRARAADLNVDTTLGNSPYLIPPNPSSFTNENVGTVAGGTIDQSGATTNTVANELTLGVPAAVTGTYDLSGGTLSVGTGATQGEIIGNSGSGTFTQTAGSNTMSDFLIVGNFPGATGTYALSGGSLSVGNDADVGFEGSGTFEAMRAKLIEGKSWLYFIMWFYG